MYYSTSDVDKKIGLNMLTNEDQELLVYIGSQLAKLRKARQMTVRELAEKMEIDNGWLSKIENGHKDIKVTTLVSFAKKLEVDVTYFLP
jgi:transcriptional regulator with XRE-family HTH domain